MKSRVFDMFSLRRRREASQRKEMRSETEAPAYPRHEEAFEYRGSSPGRDLDDEALLATENLLLKADLKPLPRCPVCSTAVGSGQRDCHTCGRDLKKPL